MQASGEEVRTASTPMSVREKFRSTLQFQEPRRVPNAEFGYWPETIKAWYGQGLPESVRDDSEAERHLGLEGLDTVSWLPISNGLWPGFKSKVLEDRLESQIVQDHEGNICEKPKDLGSIPRYIRYGLETREDWERYKNEQLDWTREDRIGDVAKAAREAHEAGMPVRFDAGSLYGWLRNWMGVERLSIAVMEEPEWVEEMMEHLTQMTLYLIEKALGGIEADLAWWWEDMCYNHGPLMSPKLFERLMVPRYQRITAELRRRGVDINVLDCDGRIYELVPGWLRGGINCMFPVEAVSTDPIELRRLHGRDLRMIGGVNKRVLAAGREAIDREIGRLRPVVEEGGFIPTVDHRVPPDVPYSEYLYYLDKKREVLAGGG